MNRPRGDPVPASAQLEETLAKMGIPGVAATLRMRREWGDMVSGRWRDKARPLVVDDGCLVLEVDSRMDATLLRYGAAGLIEEINAAWGRRVATRISIRVSRSRHEE